SAYSIRSPTPVRRMMSMREPSGPTCLRRWPRMPAPDPPPSPPAPFRALRPASPILPAAAALGQDYERVEIGDDHLLAAAAHTAFLLPGAEKPAHRMQRGAGHFRNVLPRDREIDLDAVIGLAAGLMDQPQHGACDSLLDLLRRH